MLSCGPEEYVPSPRKYYCARGVSFPAIKPSLALSIMISYKIEYI